MVRIIKFTDHLNNKKINSSKTEKLVVTEYRTQGNTLTPHNNKTITSSLNNNIITHT